MKRLSKLLLIVLFFAVTLTMLTVSIKGQPGNPIYHQTEEERNKKVGSPFESSGSTSRYALIEAMVEDKTFFFNEKRARFSAPDMVEYNSKFFSIFTPGVSFFSIPFYILGKYIGFPQLVTYLSTVLLSFLNVILVVFLAKRLGAGLYSALLAGFVFLFATNAFPYALTLSQHHLSVTLILLALANILGERSLLKNILLGAIYGAGLLVDLPNGLMMFPIIIYVLLKHLNFDKKANKTIISIKLKIVTLLVGLIPFLILFGWYNYQTTGSYTKIGQTIGRSQHFQPPEVKEKYRLERENPDPYAPKLPFNTRDQLHNFNMLLIGNERGWVFYSPVVFVGILGLLVSYKKKQKKEFTIVATTVILTDFVIYSMFGAEGGWAFGPRYLIPAAAISSSAISIAVEKYRRNVFFIVVFIILVVYSLMVNTMGAMTTTQIPPKVEAINLPNPIPYTYEYNLELIDKNFTSSLIYNLFLSNRLSVKEFVLGFYSVAFVVAMLIYLLTLTEKKVIAGANKTDKKTFRFFKLPKILVKKEKGESNV